MGEVYRAKDERLGREVAIKILPSSFFADPDRLRRFEQEARATGALNHPNVIVVHDTGQHDGAPYVVYELVEGTTLRALLTGAPLSASRTIRLGTEIGAGLAAAHDRGIVHRDINARQGPRGRQHQSRIPSMLSSRTAIGTRCRRSAE